MKHPKRRYYYHFFTIFCALCCAAGIFAISCTKSIDGEYKQVNGECQELLVIKDLGRRKYNIIMTDESLDNIDILGEKSGNRIISRLGSNSINFVIQGDKVVLNYMDKNCTYIKAK